MIGKTVAAVLVCIFAAAGVSAGQPGKTDTVFNRRFIPKVKISMPYDQLTKIAGAPGAVVKDPKEKSPNVIHYHWDGDKNSSLDATVANGKVTGGTIHAPNGNYYRIN